MSTKEKHHSAFDTPRDQRAFLAMLIGSIALHAVCFGLMAFNGRAAPKAWKSQEAIQTRLVRLGQNKPDWLPRKEEPPPPPKEEPAVVATADSKTVTTKATPKEDNKSKVDDIFKRLNELEKKSKDDYQGKGDATGSKQGTVSELTKQIIGNQWVADVQQKIRPNMDVPTAIAENERDKLKTIVALYVAASGKVLNRNIEQSSGNALFDHAVLNAIDRSSPLPPPPAAIRHSVQADGCEVTFTGRKG